MTSLATRMRMIGPTVNPTENFVDAGTFTSRTTPGTDSVNLGFQPKAVVLLVSHVGFSSTDVVDGNVQNAIVFSDGTTTRCSAIFDEDAADPTNNSHSWYSSVAAVNAAGTVVLDGDISLTATGFDIAWGTISAGWSVAYWAIGGAGISAKVLAFSKTGTGSQAYTGVGFQPKCGLFMSALSAADADTTAANSRRSFGAADDDADERSVGNQAADNAATADSSRVDSNAAVLAMRSASNGSSVLGASVTSWDADGFTANISTLAVSPSYFAGLLLGGAGIVAAELVTFTADTTTGAHTQTISGMPFDADAGFLFNMSHTATNTNQTHAFMGVGFFAPDLSQASLTVHERDATAAATNFEGISAAGAVATAQSLTTPYNAHGVISATGATSIDVTWGAGKGAIAFLWNALLLDLA